MSKVETKTNTDEVAAFVTDPETEEILNSVLTEIGISQFTVRRSTIGGAVDYLGTHSSPRLLVVDVSKSDLPLSDINNLADACEPGVEVIVVGEQNDIGLFRDLIQLGVSDYVAKPITRELMRRSIETVRRGQKNVNIKGRVGKLVAITGTRGGVGATTMCSNLGWILSQKVLRRVAMVDLDFNYGSLSLAFDQKPTPGLREAVENTHRVDQLFLERTMAQVDTRLALLSSEEPLDSEVRLAPQAYDELTDHLSKLFHYVLVDVPHLAGPIQLHVLRMAQVRIITIDPTLSSVRHAIRLLKLLGAEEIDKQTIVVLNRRWAQTSNDLSIDEIERVLGHRVDIVVPYGKNALVAAENSGDVAAASSAPIVDALMDLAQDLSGRPKAKTSIWSRWFSGSGAEVTRDIHIDTEPDFDQASDTLKPNEVAATPKQKEKAPNKTTEKPSGGDDEKGQSFTSTFG